MSPALPPATMPVIRFAALVALAALVASAPATAQNLVSCQNGTAAGFDCENVDLAAHMPLSMFGTSGSPAPSAGNDIWGWTDPQTGREYALMGVRNGTVFVDITTPDAPVFVGKLPTATSGSTWRDIKTYADHAFIVSEAGGHGMQVFDLTRLRSGGTTPRTFTADARYTGFGSAHNVVIDDESGFAYGVGVNGQTCAGGGLHIVDIRTPTAPAYAGCFDDDGYTHDAQCLVYRGPDADYRGKEICVASNEDTITFVDVSDKQNPVQISRGFYPAPRYTHQNWFTEDQRYILVDDELDPSGTGTRTIIFDAEDLDSPQFDFFFISDEPVTDHNQYVKGDYAFQSNYNGGLRILDISDIANQNIDEVAFFDTYPQGQEPGFGGQWSNYPYFESGTVVASDGDNGLFVLRPDAQFVTSSGDSPRARQQGFELTAPTPNPSPDVARLTLTVEQPQRVVAEAYDLAGRRVAVLLDAQLAPGAAQDVVFDGAELPAGTYLVRVRGEGFTASRRVVLAR